MNIELGHVIRRGSSLTSDGMRGCHCSDFVGRHHKVGGTK